MKINAFLTLSGLVCGLLLNGCSTEAAKRATHQAMDNYERQRCMQELRDDCHRSGSYDDYKKQREEVINP